MIKNPRMLDYDLNIKNKNKVHVKSLNYSFNYS